MQDPDKFYSKHYCSIFYALSMFISLEFRILGRECITSQDNGQGVHHVLGLQSGGASCPRIIVRGCIVSQDYRQGVHHVLGLQTGGASRPRIIGRGCIMSQDYRQGVHHVLWLQSCRGCITSQDYRQGVTKILHDGGMPDFLSQGVPIFLEKIAWGCQISWGAKYPDAEEEFLQQLLESVFASWRKVPICTPQ